MRQLKIHQLKKIKTVSVRILSKKRGITHFFYTTNETKILLYDNFLIQKEFYFNTLFNFLSLRYLGLKLKFKCRFRSFKT